MNTERLTALAWTQAWQLALLVVACLLLIRCCARHRPHLAYALWLVVLVKCLTPPVWSSPSGLFSHAQAMMRESMFGDDDRIRDMVSVTVAREDESFAAGVASHSMGLPSPAHVRTQESASVTRLAVSLMPTLWCGGCGVVLVWNVYRCVACWRIVRRAARVARPDLDAMGHALARRLGLRRPVRILVTASSVGPGVVGLWRPTIVLPAIVVEGKSAGELESLLAHELLHVRRGDLWVGVVQVVARLVWWFHPLVWMANRWLSREAERCCDEEVLAELRCDPATYARSLVEVLELKRSLRAVPAFPGVRPVEITFQRLERIMKLGQGCHKRTPWWCWGIALLVGLVAWPGAEGIAGKERRPARRAARQTVAPLPPAPEPVKHEGFVISALVVSGPSAAIDALHDKWSVLAESRENAPRGERGLDEEARAEAERGTAPGKNVQQASMWQRVEKRSPVLYAVVDKSNADALMTQIRNADEQLRTESAPKVIVRNEQSAVIRSFNQRPFVVGFERTTAGEIRPQVDVVTSGWTMNLLPRRTENQQVRLECECQWSEVLSVEVRELPAQAGEKPLSIQIPEVGVSKLSFTYDLPLDHALLLRGIQKPGERREGMFVVIQCTYLQANVPAESVGLFPADRQPHPDLGRVRATHPRPTPSGATLRLPAHVKSDAGVEGWVLPVPEEPMKEKSAKEQPTQERPAGPYSKLPASDETSRIDAENVIHRRTYPVGDLLAQNARGSYERAMLAAATSHDFDTLVKFVRQSVLPASWSMHGGPCTIEKFTINNSLVVSQTQEGHRQVAELLAQLRLRLKLRTMYSVRGMDS